MQQVGSSNDNIYAKAIFFKKLWVTLFPLTPQAPIQIALQLPIILACRMTQRQLNRAGKRREEEIDKKRSH